MISLSIGSSVQIDPIAHPNYAGCYATVVEILPNGAQVVIPMPNAENVNLTLQSGEYRLIGTAVWVPNEVGGDRNG